MNPPLSNTVGIQNNITPRHPHIKYISFKAFLSKSVVEISGKVYSIQDFINAIAYNGGLHNVPDKINIKEFYEKFHEVFPEIALDMVFDIGVCFVDSFSAVYEKFLGDNNAFAVEFGRSPTLAINGIVSVDKQGIPTYLFSNSYLQLPIRAKSKCGIRFSFQIKLVANKDGCIFSYGNRSTQNLNISCEVLGAKLVIQTISKFVGRILKIEIPLLADYVNDFFWLEVAIYPAGNLCVSVNEYLKSFVKIPTPFSIENGKLIVGSDLSGNHSADFYVSTWLIESLNLNNQTDFLFVTSNKHPKTTVGNIIPYDAIYRPLSVS